MHPIIHLGSVEVPAYGLCMVIGIIVAFVLSYFRLRKKGEIIDSLLLVAAVAMIIGLCCAKIFYYVFSYGLGRLFREVFSGDFSGFQDSGLVYYGGLLGGIVGAFVAIKTNKLNFDNYVNAIVPCVPLGHAFGRIGCLMAGCCYGQPYEGVFAVHSVDLDPNLLLFPIQAVESILNALLFVVLIFFTKKERKGITTLAFYIVAYSIIRFILEFFRGALIRGVYAGLSTSQWISILLILLFLLLLRMHKTGHLKSIDSLSTDKGGA